MEDEFKHLVRISRKDVDGNKTIEHALTDIKGVGLSLSKTICRILDLDLNSKIGYIADEDAAKIEEIIEDPKAFDIPSWMLNRREDYVTGEDIHLKIYFQKKCFSWCKTFISINAIFNIIIYLDKEMF